jgi:hypothetical protein
LSLLRPICPEIYQGVEHALSVVLALVQDTSMEPLCIESMTDFS